LFQPRCHVHGITVPVLALDDHIPKVNAHAHVDTPPVRQPLVAPRHLALKHCRTLDRIDHTAELGQEPIAHQLEDAAVVFDYLRLEELLAVCSKALEGVGLVLLHKTAVTNYVGGEDGGELAFHICTERLRTVPRQLY
jgi:hypothetical protein